MQDGLADLVGDAFRVAISRAFPGEFRQRLLGIKTRHDRLLRILVLQLGHVEAAAIDDLARARQRLGIIGKESVHLLRRLQEAVGMALTVEADVIDCGVIADAGDNVLHLPAAGFMEEHIIGDDGLHFVPCGKVREIMKAQPVIRAPAQTQADIGAITEDLRDLPQLAGIDVVGLVGHEDGDQAVAIGLDVRQIEDALALSAPALSQ